jgi:hypothetical protein
LQLGQPAQVHPARQHWQDAVARRQEFRDEGVGLAFVLGVARSRVAVQE